MINGNPAVSTQNPCTSNRVVYLGGIAAAGVFSSLLLISYLIISGNFEEISSPLLFTSYFLAASILLTLLLLVLFWLMPFRIAKLIAVTIAAYALISLTLDAALPLGIGELEEGTESAPAAPLWGIIVQISGTAILGFVIWRLPLALIGSTGWAITAVIIASTTVPVIAQSYSEKHRYLVVHPSDGAPSFNIYHIVLDAYYGPWLQWAVDELELGPDIFAGFTHYPAARVNYWATIHSYTSFMSGSLYTPEINLSTWEEDAKHDSIVTDLKEAGFQTFYAGIGMHAPFTAADWIDTRKSGQLGEIDYMDIALISDIWLVRAAPIGFRQNLFHGGAGLISRILSRTVNKPTGDIRSYWSYHQYLRMLETEELRPARGAYVHIHAYPPHPPWQLNRFGEYVENSNYEESMLLATNMMAMLISQLKQLGRFDQNLIIFQSDHGLTIPGRTHRYHRDSGRSFITIDDETADRISQINFRGVDGRWLDARFGALLMIKPPSSCKYTDSHTIRIDSSLVHLKDLRKYINMIIDKQDGSCIFPYREYVDIYVGTRRQVDPDGNRALVGRDLLSGELNVFRVHSDGKWEIMPNIEFVY